MPLNCGYVAVSWEFIAPNFFAAWENVDFGKR